MQCLRYGEIQFVLNKTRKITCKFYDNLCDENSDLTLLFMNVKVWFHVKIKLYDLLLVINSNLPPILHRFRDIAVDRSKIVILGYPSCV